MNGASRHPHHFKRAEAILDVVTMVSNPVRHHSRYRLFKQFLEHMAQARGVRLHIVEVAFGHRPFEMTDACNPHHLQLRTHDELWHKENAINLAVQRFPQDWKYVAWVDSDIEFMNDPEIWALEAIEQLQHYKVIQLFQQALDMGPTGEVLHVHKGFVASYLQGLQFTRQYGGWHPGYGWACTREAWNGMGGLLDFAILGSGDDHMAKSLIGRGLDSLPNGLAPAYKLLLEAWQDRALANIKKDIGYLPATIKHHFHGPKRARKYWSRWDVIKHPMFDPIRDLKRDWQGLWVLSDRDIRVRDGIRAYNRSRLEDSNEAD